ncbi:hypothetical protein [Aliarcobacter butzleri]|uniref:hypothetical protein n=1 Tax=Aliarcobacter butzleri TaxID=28197 RepID=UPI001587813E|nr:hypothetical protein [Aliarcobacter butzleri]MCG3705838.1 hypothetical protein [Aliarcobacter butzleri]MCT7556638.1 hypothetical protein [Aliarcobacter butzleri]MCT7566865.1 hypothetical protein [Aliarcobacter butzleri]MDN5072393.1 hypothetical protein [Aliarcobacter butzleri]MDN5121247.1 hypothetical protein [Aliarcobacter butzleri]
MNKETYLQNICEIEKLQKENSDYLKLIEKEELEKCPFRIGDVIRDKRVTITISNLTFSIDKKGKTNYRASGFSEKQYDMIFIDNETQKIDEFN